MKLGVPTLSRYDLLQLLLDSAERGSVKPDGYVIVDNGGLARERLRLPANTEVILPGRNLGVSASWNLLLDLAGESPIAISNDDVVFGTDSFARLSQALGEHPLLVASSERWATLYAQTPECTKRVGYYDENFWPAYYEDLDYERRLGLAGVARHDIDLDIEHVVSATLKDAPRMLQGSGCGAYYEAKWGGAPRRERYREPFNGRPPEGWALRTDKPWRPVRRSIIDHIYGRRR